MDVRTDGHSTTTPHVVWSLLSAVEAWPQWTPTVTSVTRERAETDSPQASDGIGVGSRFSVTQPRLGKASWVVTEWQEGRSFTWVSRRPGIRTTATHQLHPQDGGTRIELAITWDGPGAWLVRALFGRMTQRYTDIELNSLVTAAEARG
ncbi:SRPBCC family protein [Ornithinimicrobium cryptoxanthini]|uniref:SRPBCC family protein n=1 Tax=Ornithinimicrobium cryptoxanthini TaxID=2934161 RepID=UPI0021178FDD|nr:SRPBCC family protein [Ornithinimicrobium cryptoxanthini]